LRGAGGESSHSPPTGYRYDGIYYVESYWSDTGRSGFRIWRYRLVKSPETNPVTNPPHGRPPGRRESQSFATTQRLVRNTAVTQWVKELYAYACQICGETLRTPLGPYAEGAHIRPVGRPHDGPDEAENVLCLCPNDHVLFDRGELGLNDAHKIVEMATGREVGELIVKPEDALDPAHLRYHWGLHRGAT
jgi:putative restriction endonuclease